ncbi:hypothetical protein COCC4DRAFT_67041 [Bipolaris maydis ATCC 48331]|uniref:Uncharacterized protein n=2 Tax=Cochliobolus heterostrophus TaxID=5016 RepID=M2V136_COCH5|nr:uncharacterized protein COCC4DRAFT_67041 [Bipolaris maydis ATCC 48331]EMD93677.1 hypothetical protein COCHEDRAFT_1154257 [Bipolaris maydis C5]KAJ5020470.1 hypothetical protein J3E73DRAFT_201501 [Bipolaris maydis]ENH98799.1 hypothetical protein COCC4DRAFT_67041 [Bipolaris maydis ATCC 48331]KAJ5020628.1 hypothetical protein J3E73DRAFT_201173 [Bipolaris maydis]KAJ5027969.1 hypothetical protein J3E73DRAFT_389898 [Bipolaris maydis]
MNGKLRPMAKRVGFRNFNRWTQDHLITIFLEYDRINQTRVRDVPENYVASPADIDAQHAIVDRLIKDEKIKLAEPKAGDLKLPVPKRKRENDTETKKDKRAKVSSGDDNHVSPSDSGKSNDKRAPRNVAGTKGVSKIGSRAGGVQKKSKQVEKSAATKPRSRQASTRKPQRKKKNMDVGDSQNAESQDPSVSAVHPPFMTPDANPGDDDSSDSDSSDSRDDNGDHGNDGEDIESDEDSEAEETSKAPSKGEDTSKVKDASNPKSSEPLGLHLGVRKVVRHELEWDPLDERIPTSQLTWYEQQQRFRAQQEKARKEAQEKGLPYNEGDEPEEEPKNEWDWKRQLRRKG